MRTIFIDRYRDPLLEAAERVTKCLLEQHRMEKQQLMDEKIQRALEAMRREDCRGGKQ